MAIDTSLTLKAAAAAPDAGRAAADATQDRFLRLLVTQLQNQDPLNPMDNAQVTGQMAQLSTVSGIDRLNASIEAVLSAVAALQPVQASGLVGRDVAVEGDRLALAQGAARGGYSIEQPVESLTVTITDASGNTVRTLELGARPAGLATFAWDGRDGAGRPLPDGAYRFSVAGSAGGKPVAATSLATARVEGVLPASDGFALNLGALGIVPFGRVAQIL